MEPTVSLSFTLPMWQAERVIALVKSFGETATKGVGKEGTREEPDGGPFQFTPNSHEERKLRYLLDGRPDLQLVVRFIVKKAGEFYNDELAAELGINDSRHTFSRLGHLTRKLRKAGVRAEGFRGTNWYSTIPSSGRTMIIVREDVLPVLAEALES